jgi:hypothetical protein
LLIEYEIIAAQTFGNGLAPEDIVVTNSDRNAAEQFLTQRALQELSGPEEPLTDDLAALSTSEEIDVVAQDIAAARALGQAIDGTVGASFLLISGTLLSIILLLAQGGGYVGGAAVAANAARLGRLPNFFAEDRLGIAVIWLVSTILIPIIRQVVVVEAYYAFGFVSAFAITSTTVFFVRDDALSYRDIKPGSAEAKSLKFAGLRGMIASYLMLIVLITQKTDALGVIIVAGAAITLFQIYMANGGFKRRPDGTILPPANPPGMKLSYEMGIVRAHDQARQRGIADAVEDMVERRDFAKFNVGPDRIRTLVCYLFNIDPALLNPQHEERHERIEEPNLALEATYQQAYNQQEKILQDVEYYSHFGIFMFIYNYHMNWVDRDHGRDETVVIRAMLNLLFPLTDDDQMWAEYCAFEPRIVPERVWQFSRARYRWAKNQWPNLSDRITTIWTLQDFGLLPKDIEIETAVSIADGKRFVMVKIPTEPVPADLPAWDEEE